MKQYEVMMILDSRRVEEGGDTFAATVSADIEKLGGKVLDLVNMGRRSFSYPIGKSKAGIYLNFIIELDPSKLAAHQEQYRLNEAVLRHVAFAHDAVAARHRTLVKAGKVPTLSNIL